MPFFVYILYSTKLEKYYVGSTHNLEDRLHRHNTGQSTFTKTGTPWNLVHNIEMVTRAEAVQLEMKIKKRGAKRFLQDIGVDG